MTLFVFFTFINIEFIFVQQEGRTFMKLEHYCKNKRYHTISCFPGIVLTSQIEAFISKSNSHYLLINSPKDIKTYKKICKIIGVPFNGILLVHHGLKCQYQCKTENSYVLSLIKLMSPDANKKE